ncbi:MAG: YggS family pyridoxal phosphate-dependent enzyme [Nitrospirae bacterium]|uniref:YggS family pyridoxal phosphate-dependent enzyme n=1 Tax=Candidatus Magnetobacterium casense TaxID=1455061 RepID=UPI00058BD751|nr:YggS family pyridoxal phosphate-dependent enzyme [Candidatus Magnetobacterium casensis]MBF0337136.1 YggS family pyridoxal phosphate-dependent enzyme [Nitrospirota bacterium]
MTNNVSLIDRVNHIYKRISYAAMRADRSPDEVKLIAVSKHIPMEAIVQAIDVGLRHFGESYIQEAVKKIEATSDDQSATRLSWHLIGHLQRNKVKHAVGLFDVIHCLDSLALAREIDLHAERLNKIQSVLIQVKLADEHTKSGIDLSLLPALVEDIATLKHVRLEGLMTIPPYLDNPQEVRPYFRQLYQLREAVYGMGYKDLELSMGMSNDYEVAIEEGATLVRIGTAIFGQR